MPRKGDTTFGDPEPISPTLEAVEAIDGIITTSGSTIDTSDDCCGTFAGRRFFGCFSSFSVPSTFDIISSRCTDGFVEFSVEAVIF